LFANAVREGVITDFNSSKNKFINSLTPKGNRFHKRGVVDLLIAHTTVPSSSPTLASWSSKEEDIKLDLTSPPHVSPHILTTCPPIAQYTNDLLTALNGLRLLAPKEIYHDLVKALDAGLEEAGGRFLEILKADRDGHDDDSKDDSEVGKLKIRAGIVFFRVFLPFIRRALVEGVYNPGSELEERSNDWRKEFVVMREWEAWLQNG
jgi:hypothetical protein